MASSLVGTNMSILMTRMLAGLKRSRSKIGNKKAAVFPEKKMCIYCYLELYAILVMGVLSIAAMTKQ